MPDWGVRRQLIVGFGLLAVFVISAWSGTIGESGSGVLPTWSGLRVTLALALIGLAAVYRAMWRLDSTRSSSLLGRGAFIAGLFVVAVPTALGRFDAGLAVSELALVGAVVALWCLAAGSRAREGLRHARGVPTMNGWVLVLVIGVLWVVLTTLPLPPWSKGAIDLLAALAWGGGGLLILAVGFRADDEVISTLGIACFGIAAGQLLTLGGVTTLAAEVIALTAVCFAISAAYLELASTVKGQRGDLEASEERIKDLAHEARTAITAVEATLVGLEGDGEVAADHRDELKSALRLELQSLRLLLTRDQPEPIREIRLADLLPPIVAASRHPRTSLRWLAPTDAEAKFARGALIEILQTLIENSRTHGGATAIDIEVALAGADIEIRVIDDGVGVDESFVPQIFERGVKRWGSPGQGLGLNIARGLARAHGGELEYRGRDRGSCFVLTMPSSVRVIDLSIYEDDEIVETFDGDAAGSEPSPPDRHRGDPGFARNPHRHRGPQPGGEVAGV